MKKLPKSVEDIASVIGVEAIGREKALFLISQLPTWNDKGTRRIILSVPTIERLTTDHKLFQILGLLDASKLCRAFGGEILQPANCKEIYRPFRDENICRLVVEGVPIGMIAEWFNVSDRHVRNLIRGLPEDTKESICNRRYKKVVNDKGDVVCWKPLNKN